VKIPPEIKWETLMAAQVIAAVHLDWLTPKQTNKQTNKYNLFSRLLLESDGL
jgi:hypothetical protein